MINSSSLEQIEERPKEFKPCCVIPVYNAEHTISFVVEEVLKHGLHCVLVNDGSLDSTGALLEKIAEDNHQRVTLIKHATNQGKGAAVLAGLSRAAELGFSHALQIDADGQHNSEDIPKFLEASKVHPDALIAGDPQFDSSAPASRLWGRKLSIYLSYLETCSRSIADILCGFRVYPLRACLKLIAERSIAPRMDFDTDIAIKLVWQGVRIVNVKTAVIYPPGGRSHFRIVHDNLRLICLHILLLLELLFRLRALLSKNRPREYYPASSHSISRKVVDDSQWYRHKERGTIWAVWLGANAAKLLGPRFFRIFLYPIIAYFFLTSAVSRRASRDYLERVYADPQGRLRLKRRPDLRMSYAHLYAFGQMLVDRVAVWTNCMSLEDVEFENLAEAKSCVERGQGALLVSAHLGSVEVVRAVSEHIPDVKVNALMFTKNVQMYGTITASLNANSNVRIIPLENVSAGTVIDLKQKIAKGELVAVLGDRPAAGAPERVQRIPFLREEASFPEGPWVLASLLECPVFVVFCLRQDTGKYRVSFENFAEKIVLPRAERNARIRECLERYSEYLEKYCLRSPLQWFNFYQFWDSLPQEKLVGTKERSRRS